MEREKGDEKMIDEKIVYGGLTEKERTDRKAMYWGFHIYKDLVQLKNRLHDAKKDCKDGELGVLAEFDVQNLIDKAKELAEIDWENMPDMDKHSKVVWADSKL